MEYLGHIKDFAGNKREEEVEIADNSTIGELLTLLSERHGDMFKKAIYDKEGPDIKPNFMATINGYLLNQLEGVKTRLKKGDHVVLMPVVSGG